MYLPRRARSGERLPLAAVSKQDAPRRANLAVADADEDEAVAIPRHQSDETLALEADAVQARPWLRLVAAPLTVLAVAGVAIGAVATTGASEASDGATTPVPTASTIPSIAVSAPAGWTGLRGEQGSVSRGNARPSLSPSAVATPTPAPSERATPKPLAQPSAVKPAASKASTVKPSATKPSGSPSANATPTKSADLRPGNVVGTRYTTAAVRVRAAASTESEQVSMLSEGEKVSITDRKDDGWRQVKTDKGYGWVKADYLTSTKPASSTSTDSGSTTSSSISDAACPSGSGVESGLTSNAIAVHRAVCHAFPFVKSYGGLRPGDPGAHGQGRALDIMVSGDAGWQIARWVRANASRLGVTEVIYSQQIWTTQRSSEGWRHQSDRGSATANHYDHVHVTVR